MSHPCPLNGCTGTATTWTVCDSCAKTHKVWIPHTPDTPAAVHHQAQYTLTDAEYDTLAASASNNTARNTAKAIGISNKTVGRILRDGPAAQISRPVHTKIQAWITAGAHTEGRQPGVTSGGHRAADMRLFTREHYSIICRAYDHHGTRKLAATAIGISTVTFDRLFRREINTPASPTTIAALDAWATAHPAQAAA